jgi:hypothetical protein
MSARLGVHVPAIVTGVCAALAAVTLVVTLARRPSEPAAHESARGRRAA